MSQLALLEHLFVMPISHGYLEDDSTETVETLNNQNMQSIEILPMYN